MKADDNTAVLLLHCPDQPGILAAVTEFINQHKGNILYLDQYVNREEQMFFMRIKWDLTDFRIPKEKISEYFQVLLAERYQMNFRLYFSDTKPRMAIFVSKMAHCLYDLLARYAAGEWYVEIPLIISNHAEAQEVAKDFGIKFVHLPVTPENKAQQEIKQMTLLKKHEISLVVLARYHQILSENFVEQFKNRIINIHHSFLPSFPGSQPYAQAYEKGVKLIGATCHYVTAHLDEGPIIEQDTIRVSHRDSLADMVRQGEDIEKAVLSRSLRWALEHKILCYNNKTVVFD